MQLKNFIRPEQVAMLASVLDAHCSRFGIRSPEGKESAALSIMTHFNLGIRDEKDLASIIAQEDDPDRAR